MKNDNLEILLKKLLHKHLNVVIKYDPYKRFSDISNNDEFLDALRNDPAFNAFNFANQKYVKARIYGNLITSLHRKIGDFYEEAVREII